MTRVDINLNTIKETPLLLPGKYELKITSAGMGEKRPSRIWARLVVEGYKPFFHSWYETDETIHIKEPSICLWRFCKLVWIEYDPVNFNCQQMVGVTFRGKVTQELYNGETQVRLDKVFDPRS